MYCSAAQHVTSHNSMPLSPAHDNHLPRFSIDLCIFGTSQQEDKSTQHSARAGCCFFISRSLRK